MAGPRSGASLWAGLAEAAVELEALAGRVRDPERRSALLLAASAVEEAAAAVLDGVVGVGVLGRLEEAARLLRLLGLPAGPVERARRFLRGVVLGGGVEHIVGSGGGGVLVLV